MNNLQHKEIRNILIEALKEDLEGPANSTDDILIIDQYPPSKYVTGMLFPIGTIIDKEDDEEMANSEESDDDANTGTFGQSNLSLMQYPSSLGLNFVIFAEDLDKLQVCFRGGLYIPLKAEPVDENPVEEDEQFQLVKFECEGSIQQLAETELTSKLIDFTIELDKEFVSPLPDLIKETEINDLLQVSCSAMVSPSEDGKVLIVNISFLNSHKTKSVVSKIYFHSNLSIRSDHDRVKFLDRRKWRSQSQSNTEDAKIHFINRNVREFGVGRGTAPNWRYNDNNEVVEIFSDNLPYVEVPLAFHNIDAVLDIDLLRMQKLAEDDVVLANLSDFLKGYKTWHASLEVQSKGFTDADRITADELVEEVGQAINRIQVGLEYLMENPLVTKSFRLMNLAMHTMRVNVNQDEDPKWRPFQLAFILYSLESLLNRKSDDRDVMELLWFPTGGGKTEAYLGLMAAILTYRRLTEKSLDAGAGTVVISRYTLRLLTLQQFRRASALICALEIMRKGDSSLGQIEFNIGLWVGNNATPGTVKQARQSLSGTMEASGSILQYRNCPWCDTELDENIAYINFRDEENNNPKIRCPNSDCEFTDGLPIYMTDEQVYANCPSVVLGTVDKFARIPKIRESGNILGAHPTYDPPDLIIQDELHLIDGPLGSMYGVSEMMIHLIIKSNSDGFLPKLISSTATIKRAESLIRTLYSRKSKIFPPTGYSYGDTFWSKIGGEDQSTRGYIGVLAQGKSPKWVYIKIQSVLLTKIWELKQGGATDEILDPYWTLVGYFNSLRELGGAMMLIRDDIPARMQSLAWENNIVELRLPLTAEELTSRLASSEVADMLDKLEVTLTDKDQVLDTVYATNMISVGVDVDRLSIMHIAGQPKRTAEYIQASARVGRKFPGLVITQYRWNMPRDRSHYERFPYFHLTMNTLIDPLSATPYSTRSLDRSLHGAVIGILRHIHSSISPESAAGSFTESLSTDILKDIEQWVRYAENMNEESVSYVLSRVRQIVSEWERYSLESNKKVNYSRKSKGRNRLMISMTTPNRRNEFYPKKTPDSLRNVESSAELRIQGYGDEK